MATRANDRDIGRNIKGLRRRKGLSQSDLAASRFTSAYVSLIESGKRSPSRSALAHFAERLGVTEEDLMTGRQPDLELQMDLEIQEAKALIYGGHVDLAQARLEKLLTKARRNKLKIAQARIHQTLGTALENTGGAQAALDHFQAAEGLLRNEPAALRVGAVCGISRIMQRLGDGRYGVYALESLLQQVNAEGPSDPEVLMSLYSSLAGAYYEIGLIDKAVDAAGEAERLSDETADPEQLACTYITVARAYLRQGRKTDALRALLRGEDMYSRLGWSSEVAGARINRGIVLTEKGELDQAREVLESAIDGLSGHGNPLLLAKAMNELARVERLAGQSDNAVQLLGDAQQMIAADDLNEQAFNSRERGLALRALGSPDAEEFLRRAVDLYRRSNNTAEVASSLKALGDLLVANGRTEEAVEAFREGLEAVEERPA